jgi:hypothetical protein
MNTKGEKQVNERKGKKKEYTVVSRVERRVISRLDAILYVVFYIEVPTALQ